MTNQEKSCNTCGKCVPIGEGEHICEEDPTLIVLEDYLPTDDYYWCDGRYWEGK